jgi:hypothetical protein
MEGILRCFASWRPTPIFDRVIFESLLPSVHQMVLTMEANGFIDRIPGQGRSIRLKDPTRAVAGPSSRTLQVQ